MLFKQPMNGFIMGYDKLLQEAYKLNKFGKDISTVLPLSIRLADRIFHLRNYRSDFD
jgi:hypothetical protein